ncbi:hypothetical protein VA249_14690 [Vibrio alfacsensis]|uniref:hypothetical protein n=1 Tax=Vibrio alfacsensis TaxID=1074311 RepID=UPI001BED48B9|nr:hypothetical protein [Vibrio alfacsensis]BBM64823.1 hypothetical protein VA249_14690 [Vibrio alfacsensis]
MITNTPGSAVLGFNNTAGTPATFTVDYNSAEAPTFTISDVDTAKFLRADGSTEGSVVFSDASGEVSVDTPKEISGKTFSIGVAATLAEHEYLANDAATVSATVTVTCAADEAAEG